MPSYPTAAGAGRAGGRLNFIELTLNNIDAGGRQAQNGPVDERRAREVPGWIEALAEEDLAFLRRFLLTSGSLKDLAAEYGVSYPTVRARLDRLIGKVKAAEDPRIEDPFERKVRMLVADMKLPAHLGKELLDAHRSSFRRRAAR